MNNTNHKASNYPLQEAIIMNKGKRISRKSSKKKEEALKVVYISTPMKVTTSASKFREIVQELTGRESDVVRIMETSGGNDTWHISDDHDHHLNNNDHNNNNNIVHNATSNDDDDGRVFPFVLDHGSSPSSSSEELVDRHGGGGGGGYLTGQDSNFGIFDQSTSLFYDHLFQHLDVLNSY